MLNSPAPDIESLALLLKAAGDDFRLTILQVLVRDSYGVLELAQALEVKQSGMSHHLKILANAGLLVTRREGNSIFYRRASLSPTDTLVGLKRELFRQIDAAGSIAYVAGLTQVWHERAQASRKFFLENAGKFKARQDLIASFDVYHHHVAELLALSPITCWQAALEVGPGEGEFLPELSARFSQVLALDNSPEMLAKARHLAEQTQLDNVAFVEGDTTYLQQQTAAFDCAVANMVLHHTPSPASLLADISTSLKPGGVLLLTELCRHDQSWTQEACGDLWLGFDPEDLQSWAETAGLKEGQSVYFALRNGFQIQVRQFIKPPL
jgi:ubiquinone/menaquinone biosynthesis C-methylase UbiE